MEVEIAVRQILLFSHIILFALAFSTIAREDFRLLFTKQIDTGNLLQTARAIKWLLAALWVTGGALIVLDIGLDLAILAGKPKILAKLLIVAALTLNGILLHAVVFPMLTTPQCRPRRVATVAVVLGSISTSSWLYASFVGVARLIAPFFTFADFMSLYAIVLIGGVSVAVLVVRDRFEAVLKRRPGSVGPGLGGPGLVVEAEAADRQPVALYPELDPAIALLNQIRIQVQSIREGLEPKGAIADENPAARARATSHSAA